MSKLRQLLFLLPHRLVNSNRFGVRWGFFALLLATSQLFPIRMVSAYVLEGPQWPADTTVTFEDELGSPGKALQDGSGTWSAAVAPIFGMWNDEVQRVVLTHNTNSAPVSSGDGLNTISFASSVFGQSFGTYTLAVTYYRSQGSSMVEADILFNRAQTFDSYRGPLQYGSNGFAIADIRRVLLHEMGHALGLGHPDDKGQHVDAVMNSTISDRETTSSDDIAGAQSLYGAPVASATPTPAPSAGSSLGNISTRVRVGVNDQVLIGGFIISGSQAKKVILRAIGPSLAKEGVTGVLANPTLELRDSKGALVASNDNWQTSAQADEISASGVAPTDPLEAAIYQTLAPGSYTAIVRGANSTSGVALVEAYSADNGASKFVNLSTRGEIGTTGNALIGGFIVGGSGSTKVYLRARGPSLGTGANAVAGALANPMLELHDASGNLLASNDDWANSSQAAAISATGIPPSDARESALISTLSAGSYTAIVRGSNGTTGIGMVEIFSLDQ